MAKLTERQQNIKNLFQEGKTAAEIADILGITPNGVYQQRRRIREIEGGSRSTSGRQSRARSNTTHTTRNPGGRSAPSPTPAPVEEHHDTPLQAIRHRRNEIRAQVKVAADNLADAQRELKSAQESHDKLQARFADELKQLDKAEQALTGRPAVRAVRRPSGSKDGVKAATGTQGGSPGPSSPNGDGEAGKPEGAQTRA